MKEENDLDESIEECECCLYKAPLKHYNKRIFIDEKDMYLCDICSSTFISKVYTEHNHSYHDTCFSRSLGYIANKILDEIRSLK